MFYTYIIESQCNGKWYYGHTENIERRVKDHNEGLNKSTKNRGPWLLIFARSFETKIEANRFELKLKKLKNKDYIRREFQDYFIGV